MGIKIDFSNKLNATSANSSSRTPETRYEIIFDEPENSTRITDNWWQSVNNSYENNLTDDISSWFSGDKQDAQMSVLSKNKAISQALDDLYVQDKKQNEESLYLTRNTYNKPKYESIGRLDNLKINNLTDKITSLRPSHQEETKTSLLPKNKAISRALDDYYNKDKKQDEKYLHLSRNYRTNDKNHTDTLDLLGMKKPQSPTVKALSIMQDRTADILNINPNQKKNASKDTLPGIFKNAPLSKKDSGLLFKIPEESKTQKSAELLNIMNLQSPQKNVERTVEVKNIAEWTTPINDKRGQIAVFDGKTLKIYDTGILVKEFKAQAGKEERQTAEFQYEKDKGPLPSGMYVARMEKYQEIKDVTTLERLAGSIGLGPWPGATTAWGSQRVWLDSAQNNHMGGRGNFSIHGGKSPGSKGCIDLLEQMDGFADWYKKNGKDLVVKVEY